MEAAPPVPLGLHATHPPTHGSRRLDDDAGKGGGGSLKTLALDRRLTHLPPRERPGWQCPTPAPSPQSSSSISTTACVRSSPSKTTSKALAVAS